SESAPHSADPLAAWRSSGHAGPRGRGLPASPTLSVPRRPPRFEAPAYTDARRSGRLFVPSLLAQAHREAGAGSPGGVRSGVLRVPAEGDDGTGQPLSRDRSEHFRTAPEPGRASRRPGDAPDGPRTYRPRRRGGAGSLLQVQSWTWAVRRARGVGGSRRRGEAGSQGSSRDRGIGPPLPGP